MNSLGFIGVGDLADYTIRGLRLGGFEQSICLSPRNRQMAQLLANECGCDVMSSNQAVIDASDMVVLATRPEHCLDALAGLEFKPNQLLVSVAAGVSVESLRQAVRSDVVIVRAMPVNCAQAAASPTLIYPAHPLVQQLFDYCGNAIAVTDEAAFDHGSVIACVYTWYFELFETLIQSTSSDVLPRAVATELILGMAKGAASLAIQDKSTTPGEIANHIATEGTYSKLGLDLLKNQNAFQPWHDACELLSKELVKGE